jgi:hypothetical protein
MRPPRLPAIVAALIAAVAGADGRAAAQGQIVIRTNVFFYGDNTEFRNPFREGETIFGAAGRVTADIEAAPRVTLSLGGLVNQRFGSDHATDLARPVLSLTVAGKRSAFLFGTLPAHDGRAPSGPDRMGPHGLLPPLQRETLTFERPFEAGLQWRFSGAAIGHEMWLVWQRLNSPEHRERLDAGLNAELRAAAAVSIPVQLHIVHEGGQLYASGPVADSIAAAAGVNIHGRARSIDRASLELYALGSRFVADRSRPGLSRDGLGFFGRGAVECGAWRAHLIAWRGRNFIKDEGDPNYLSVTRAGVRYHGTRDYAEAGLSRRFTFGETTTLDVSGRLHRVEQHYAYSYRITSTVAIGWRVH